MSRNIYSKKLRNGYGIEELDVKRIFLREGSRMVLFSLQELIRIYPDYKIIKDTYIAFTGTDVLIHIDNYNHYITKQIASRNGSIIINPLQVDVEGSNLVCIKLDNGSLNNHRVHYIYDWMIKVVTARSSTVVRYEVIEDLQNLPAVDFSTKDLTPMSFKKDRKGMVWM